MATAQADILIKARDQASSKLASIGKSVGSMAGMLKAAAVGVAGYFSARAVLDFAQASVKAFLEQEKAVNQLTAALGLLGKAQQSADMRRFAAQIQKVTTVGDETTLSMMALGASLGKMSGDTLKQATVAAIGMSKAFGMDLETAMRLVSRAAVGDTASLKRYGIVLDENASAAEKFQAVLDIGRQKFAMAEAETKTFGGRLAQLKNAWGDIKEQIGQVIAENETFNQVINASLMVAENFGVAFKLALTEIQLQFIQLGEDIKYLFTVKLTDTILNFFNLLFATFKRATKGMIDQLTYIYGVLFKGEKFDWKKFWGMEELSEAWSKFGESAKERQKTAVEKDLEERSRQLSEQLTQKMLERKQVQKTFAPAEFSGVEEEKEKKKKSAKIASGLAAVESRFLSGRSMSTTDYQQQTAKNTQQQIKLLERIAALLAKGGGKNLAVRETMALQAARLI